MRHKDIVKLLYSRIDIKTAVDSLDNGQRSGHVYHSGSRAVGVLDEHQHRTEQTLTRLREPGLTIATSAASLIFGKHSQPVVLLVAGYLCGDVVSTIDLLEHKAMPADLAGVKGLLDVLGVKNAIVCHLFSSGDPAVPT